MSVLKLFLLDRTDNWGYDDYDAIVVAALSADAALRIHPCTEYGNTWSEEKNCWIDPNGKERTYDCWTHISNIKVKEIGIANPSVKADSVVLASFNAG